MDSTPKLPRSYEDWSSRQLREECRRRKLYTKGVKHQIIGTLVEDAKAKRAAQPRIEFTEENDLDGVLEEAQIEKNFEDKMRDLSAVRAEATYYARKLKQCEK